MIRLFLFLLWVWGLGAIAFSVVALSDLIFRGEWRGFLKRLALCVIWPVALLSANGRALLFRLFRVTQEPSK